MAERPVHDDPAAVREMTDRLLENYPLLKRLQAAKDRQHSRSAAQTAAPAELVTLEP